MKKIANYPRKSHTMNDKMRIFKNRRFASFSRKEDISDADLCDTTERANRGLIDADLGGGVIKQRIARRKQGKSGGFRSIIVFQMKERAVFVYGFAKNQRDNISADELKVLKELAKDFSQFSAENIQNALEKGAWIEVITDEENLQK